MTYGELRNFLNALEKTNPTRLEDTVTVYLRGQTEFFPVLHVDVQDGDDVLDDGHVYLYVAE